jgi:hypothetical protein
MDLDWTNFPKTRVTIPGRWRSPNNPARRARVLTEGQMRAGHQLVTTTDLT